MTKHQCIRVSRLSRYHVSLCYRRMNRTSALQKHYILFRTGFFYECTKIAVRNEQYLVSVHVFYYLHRRRGSNANVANPLECSCSVYVAYYLSVRLLRLYHFYHLRFHLLCHWTACRWICKIYVLVRVEHFCRLSHKMHSAHKYVFV